MLKGYPIGYIMLWESPADYENKKSTIGSNAKTYETPKELVIDGQQRLTALVAAMFAVKVKDKHFADREIKISYNPLTQEFAVWTQAFERDAEWISRISDVFLAKEDNSISIYNTDPVQWTGDCSNPVFESTASGSCKPWTTYKRKNKYWMYLYWCKRRKRKNILYLQCM